MPLPVSDMSRLSVWRRRGQMKFLITSDYVQEKLEAAGYKTWTQSFVVSF